MREGRLVGEFEGEDITEAGLVGACTATDASLNSTRRQARHTTWRQPCSAHYPYRPVGQQKEDEVMTGSAKRQVKLLATGVVISVALAACGGPVPAVQLEQHCRGCEYDRSGVEQQCEREDASGATGGGGYLGPGPTSLGIRPDTGARATKAAAAGLRRRRSPHGGSVRCPEPGTIGSSTSSTGSSPPDRLADTTKYAAAQLGVEVDRLHGGVRRPSWCVPATRCLTRA